VLFGKTYASSRQRAPYHSIATTVPLPGPLNRQQFLGWIKTLPKELERAKGYFRFGKESELQEFQYALPGQATITPVTLLDEPTPALVLIGRGYDVERLQTDLLATVEKGAGTS
jgi:G3E family GTPase